MRPYPVVLGFLALANAPIPTGADRLLTMRMAEPMEFSTGEPSASVSADGRYVAFVSYARLVAADTNDAPDIYVLDLQSGSVTLETLTTDKRTSLQPGTSPSISGDGRFLVYEATGDSGADGGLRADVALRDRWRNTTDLICDREPAPDGACAEPRISADSRTIVFTSFATNLVSGPDANGAAADVYVFERETRTIRRVSVDSQGRQSPLGTSFGSTISADGRYVAFVSSAPLDSTAAPNSASTRSIYLRDLLRGVTTQVSVAMHGDAPNGASYQPSLSGDGRWVAFTSDASNLAPRDSNHGADVFLYDRDTRTTLLVTRSRSGESANGGSRHPAISAEGRAVAFQSDASDLACGPHCVPSYDDINLVEDVFLFDRASGAMRCLSRSRSPWMERSIGPAIDGSGSVVAFSSRHPVDARDVKDDFDLYVRVNASVDTTRKR